MTFEVLNGGPLSTVQDLGRFGVMGRGFCQNGAMDSFSLKLANRLVGNFLSCACVEMTVLGMSVRFNGEGVIALTGGDMSPNINGNGIKMNKAYQVRTGDVLTCSVAKCGVRCYLALQGGVDVERYLGSRSTDIRCALGGYQGRKLASGDVLKTGNDFLQLDDIDKAFVPYEPYGDSIVLRCVKGPQDFMFDNGDIDKFFSSQYKVSPQSDRMGVRLTGSPLQCKNDMDILSDGIPLGSVQVPKSGEPIVLTADHQTTGGYAKIATVITVDLPKAAQAPPGTTVRFEAVSPKFGAKLLKKEKRYFERLIF